jgi:hypothetical protein
MEAMLIAIFSLYAIVMFIGVIRGLDLKKWSSWLYGIFGFLCGFLVGFLMFDVRTGLEGGALSAFVVLYGGAMNYWHRQRFR